MARSACAALLFTLAACKFETAVPPRVVLTCASDADCPNDYKCQMSVGMCWSTVSDGVAPSIVATDLPVRLAKKDTALTLRLTASELLQAAPVVVFMSDEAWSAAATATPPSYAFTYTALGTEPEGADAVTATLTDTTGTVSLALPVGTVTFDFTPPSVASSTLVYAAGSTALGKSNAATLEVTLSEPLASPPVLTDSQNQVVATWNGNVGNVHQFSLVANSQVMPTLAQIALTLDATDLAGNASSTQLTVPLVLDTVVPTPPDTSAADRVVYHRAPFGDLTRAPYFELSGAQGSVEGAGTVVVTAIDLNNLELARGPADATGAFGPLTLPPVDVVRLAIAFIDPAGNTSVTAPVLDVEWIASPASSSATASPHLIETQSAATTSFTQNPALTPLDPNPAGRDDLTALTVSSGAIWREHTAAVPTLNATLVSAPGLAGLYLFDGTQPYSLANQENQQSFWRSVPLSDPEHDGNPLDGGVFGYDELHREVVLANAGQTWLFAGASWKNALAPPPPAPAVATWDPDRARLVWVSGAGLWAFDGAAWSKLSDAGVAVAAAAYDRARSELLAMNRNGGVAAWPAGGNGWVPRPAVPDAGTTPDGGRPFVRLVWDDETSRIIARAFDPQQVLSGAPGGACPNLNNTMNYAWDGTQWATLGPLPNTFPPTCGDVAFEPHARHVVQVFGLFGGGPQLAILDGGLWTGQGSAPIVAPVPSAAHVLFDHQGIVVRWGGHDDHSLPVLSSTIDYLNGAYWSPAGGFNNAGIPISSGASAVALPDYSIAICGGTKNVGPSCQAEECGCGVACNGGGCGCPNPPWIDNWQHWLYFASYQYGAVAHPTFICDQFPRLGYEPVRAKLLVATRGQLFAVDPVPDGGFATLAAAPSLFTYDGRGYIVGVFGDNTTRTLGSTETDWTVRSTSLPPASLLDMAADPATGHAVLVATDGRVYEWSGTDWATVVISDPFSNHAPPSRSSSPVASSASMRALVLYGGTGASGTLNDTWELRFAGLQPAAVLRVDLTSAGFPPDTALTQVTMNARADSASPDGGSAGVQLQLWDGLHWNTLAVTDAGSTLVSAQIDASTTTRLTRDATQLSVRALSNASSAEAPSQLTLDAIDVSVHARLSGH